MAGALGLLGRCGALREGSLGLWGSRELDLRSQRLCACSLLGSIALCYELDSLKVV